MRRFTPCSIILSMSCSLCFVAIFFHLAPLMHHLSPLLISSFLSSFLLSYLSIHDKKGGSIPESIQVTGLYRHFYMTHVHILRESNSTLCTFVWEESHRGDAYTKGRRHCFMRKPCFTLCLFSRCFMVLWVMFSIIYALLLFIQSYIQYVCEYLNACVAFSVYF